MGSRVHRVNSLNETFVSDMSKALRNVTVNLRNTIFMRILKNVTVMNMLKYWALSPGLTRDLQERL